MQKITAILYFASAAIAYELVLSKIFPDVPTLEKVIGVISRSTGTLIRYFTGTTLLAATIYAIRNKRLSEPSSNLEKTFIESQSVIVPNHPNLVN
jgi:hypothetical protein